MGTFPSAYVSRPTLTPRQSAASQNGAEVTSIREDDIELGQHSVDTSRYVVTEIKGEVTNTRMDPQPRFQW